MAYVPSLELLAARRSPATRARSRGCLITRAETRRRRSARPRWTQIYHARRPRARRRHHRRAGQRQVDAGRRSSRADARTAATGSASSPIDPSSPFSGGAILGDRIRMSELGRRSRRLHPQHGDARRHSAAWRAATLDAVDMLDAAGYDIDHHRDGRRRPGRGRDRQRAAHTTVVVSAPGLGDEIQAIKAGILEIADIHVVSKCDRPTRTARSTDLKTMLALGRRSTAAEGRTGRSPVIGDQRPHRRRRRRSCSTRSTRHRAASLDASWRRLARAARDRRASGC